MASSFSDVPGTLIHGDVEMNNNVGEIRNRVSGIATDTNVAKITVQGVKDRPGIAASLFEPLADVGISVDVIVQNASVGGTTDLTFTVKRDDLSRATSVVEKVAEALGSDGLVTALGLAKVSRGHRNAGCARLREHHVPHTSRRWHQYRDDHDVRDQDYVPRIRRLDRPRLARTSHRVRSGRGIAPGPWWANPVILCCQ